MAPDLTGKFAIVTGATSGIGLVTAEYLASEARPVPAAPTRSATSRQVPQPHWSAPPPPPPGPPAPTHTVRPCTPLPPDCAECGAEVMIGVRNVDAGNKVCADIK